MTAVWPPSPVPRETPEPETLSPVVVGPRGTRYLDCGTVAGVDKHIKMLQKQLVAHAQWPGRVNDHWQDLDALLDRRRLLDLEAWVTLDDLPL